MKKLIYSLGLTLCALGADAQNYVDILKVSANTTSNNRFDSSNSTTKLKQVDADLSLPFKLSEKNVLISGLIYERFETKLMAAGPVLTFGSATLKLGINRTFNDKWSGTFVFLPKIASDYGTFQYKEFQAGGMGLMKFKKRENLFFKFGLYYNSELFGPFFVPMAGLYYLSPDKKLETNLMLPLLADVNYKIISFISLGANFNGQIRSYHLNNVDAFHHSTYLSRSTNEFFAYLKFSLFKNFNMQTKVGYSVARSLRVYDSSDKVNFGLPATFVGDSRKQLNSDFSDGLIFQLGFVYRVNLDPK
jgi:hypothetical protein